MWTSGQHFLSVLYLSPALGKEGKRGIAVFNLNFFNFKLTKQHIKPFLAKLLYNVKELLAEKL